MCNIICKVYIEGVVDEVEWGKLKLQNFKTSIRSMVQKWVIKVLREISPEFDPKLPSSVWVLNEFC
jgi:hypothetical protein